MVERPASAVKELVENALDAGAERIAITIELGGKRLIRVEDDGEGMTADDATLALERHATSKVSRLEDLSAISTLGFAGGASKHRLGVACDAANPASGAPHGSEIRVDGGLNQSVQEVGMPKGTVVEVAELFYNVPGPAKVSQVR